jgi:hypothetical protein
MIGDQRPEHGSHCPPERELSLPSLILFGLIATSSISVTGLDWCPSSDAVQKHLDALVGEQGAPGRSARLQYTPSGLQVALLEGDGTLISQRTIPTDRSCDDLAEIVALVLASWLSDLASQAVSAKPLPSLSIPSPTPTRPTKRSWSWEIGLAPTGSFAGSNLAPGALLQVGLGPARGRWEARLTGIYDGPRQAPEGPGAVSWQRFQAGLGGIYALSRSPYSVEIGGDVVLSDVLLHGVGFSPDASSASLDPGLDLTARLVLLRGHWHPWIGIWATLWIRQEFPSVQGLTAPSALPQVEGFAGLGLSWQSVERF